jgi:hypothetical protein
VPVGLIGWIAGPFAMAFTLWVAFARLRGTTLPWFGVVALTWVAIAVAGDYVFIVRAFAPPDGYYKFDVYLYYALTVAIPLLAGWRRTSR